MFDDLLKDEEINLEDLILEDEEIEEEKYEICDKCDGILVEGQECDCGEDECGDDCGCIGVGCCKKS